MKGKAKKPLTMDEHKEIGRRLREMRKELVSMEVQIYNHLPQTEHKFKLASAVKSIDAMRIILEENMFRHYGAEATIHVYYGRYDEDASS